MIQTITKNSNEKRNFTLVSNLIFIIIVTQNISIYSFTPGKWSPLDRNVLGLEQLGPSSEIVKNEMVREKEALAVEEKK